MNRGGRYAAAAAVAVWLLAVLLWLQPGVVRPDGAGYLVYLPSTWLDRDLLFFDEWQQLGMIRDGVILHKDVTRTNHLGNHWTSGSAMAWYPAFVLAGVLRRFTGHAPNGLSLPYNVAVVATSALCGLATLLAGMRAARDVAKPGALAMAAIGAWLGTPLLWYAAVHATMSHAVSAFACALVVLAAVMLRERPDRATMLLAGLAAGFAFAVRPQNAPFALVAPMLDRRALSLPYAAGLALGALPQLVVSSFLYGAPFGFVTGGGTNAFAAFERIWWWEPLLSWYHGLVPWTPFAAAGVIGLVLLYRRDRKLAVACLAMFAAQWLINATLERTFWGATAFGQRRFDNCTVVFLIGSAALLDRIGRVAGAVLIAATSLWTMSIFLAARAGLDLSRYHTPAELLVQQGEALRGFDLTLLGAVPPQARATVLACFAVVVIAACTAIAVLRKTSMPTRAALASAYFAAMTMLFAFSGWRGRARVDEYRPLIERNRAIAAARGGADARFALLRDELDYLRRSGRHDEAERTAAELRALLDGRR